MWRKIFIPNVIEDIFFEILLPKTTPITVSELFIGDPAKLTEILNMTFEKVDTKKEIYIYGDFNINMYHNDRYIVCDDNTEFLSHDVKSYHQFCTMHGLRQIIQSPTSVTSSSSTEIDLILTSTPSRLYVFVMSCMHFRVNPHCSCLNVKELLARSRCEF